MIIIIAAQNISLMRTEPDDLQQLPCPHQRQEFQCQILVTSFALQWTVPTGGSPLEFGAGSDIGDMENSTNNVYSATLTNRTVDPNSSSRFFFTSTLLVVQPVNRSTLTCVGLSGADPVENSTTIILSGKFSHN